MSNEKEDTPFKTCFEVERRVELSETDLAGIVHFSNFYRYMETVEHAFFRSIDHSVHETVGERTIGWPRVQASCEFFKPARFEDLIVIQLGIEEIRKRSVRYRYRFLAEDREILIAEGLMTTVCVEISNSEGAKTIPVPESLRSILQAAKESEL